MSKSGHRRAARVDISSLVVGRCSCGKRSYATKGQAEAAMHLILAGMSGPDPAPSSRALNAYNCSLTKSGQWHIGHKPPNKRAGGGGR